MTYSVITRRGPELPTEYRGLVYSKWLRSLRYGNDFFKLIDAKCYYTAYHRRITIVLDSHDCVIRLAVLSDDRDVVLGFSVSRDHVLDYVHVHRDQRRQGIGTSLIPPGVEYISHLTKTGLTIWGSKYGHWRFDPFA